jgi:RNA polymerase sigma-70 factor (ECF subfamily)
MLGNFDEAEDLVQETFLRAWRARDTVADQANLRAWLYRIATNACLDFLRRNTRRPQRYEPLPGVAHGDGPPPARITWLQPFPDELLDSPAPGEQQPDALAVSRETIELVFLAAIQHLTPRQRAVLILRDVLEWPAAEAAGLLEMSVASVNSVLQRARPALRKHLPERRGEWGVAIAPTAQERAILDRYLDAALREDVAAMADLLSADARLTMPPNPLWFSGREAILNFVRPVFDRTGPDYFGQWRHLPTVANRMPAAAGYIRRPGSTVFQAQLLDVLRVEDGRIVEITTFGAASFPAFGLPPTLDREFLAADR